MTVLIAGKPPDVCIFPLGARAILKLACRPAGAVLPTERRAFADAPGPSITAAWQRVALSWIKRLIGDVRAPIPNAEVVCARLRDPPPLARQHA